jgi:hypothetical protein
MKLSILMMSLILLSSSVHAQESDRVRPPSVTAQGEAVIIAEPDQAQIDIGVLTQARTAPDAAKENAEKLSRVLAQIKKLLRKGDEVKTTGYTLNPNYRYPQGGKPEITGYTAANVLQIRTGDLPHSANTRYASGSTCIRRTDTGRDRHHRGALVSDTDRGDGSPLAMRYPEQQHTSLFRKRFEIFDRLDPLNLLGRPQQRLMFPGCDNPHALS